MWHDGERPYGKVATGVPKDDIPSPYVDTSGPVDILKDGIIIIESEKKGDLQKQNRWQKHQKRWFIT